MIAERGNEYLVKRVALTDSIRRIPAGVTALFTCREAGPMSSAAAAICRLNQAAGRTEYSISSPDNGITYTITHNPKKTRK